MNLFYHGDRSETADKIETRGIGAVVVKKLLIVLVVNGGVILCFALLALLITSLTGQPPIIRVLSSLAGAIVGTPLGIYTAKKVTMD